MSPSDPGAGKPRGTAPGRTISESAGQFETPGIAIYQGHICCMDTDRIFSTGVFSGRQLARCMADFQQKPYEHADDQHGISNGKRCVKKGFYNPDPG